MSQPDHETAGAADRLRRNPRRATRHTNGAAFHPSGAPNPRVTRRSARLLTATSALGGANGFDNLDDDEDDSDNDSDSDANDADDDGAFPRPRNLTARGCQPSLPQTIASTRERRRPAAAATLGRVDRFFTVTKSRGRAASSPKPLRQALSTPIKKATSQPSRFGSARKKSTTPASREEQPRWPTSKVIPPWPQLEWTILVQIFEYASYPLDSKSNIRWLFSAGFTCKSFMDAAMKALYKAPMPQIISMNMAYKFSALISELAANEDAAVMRRDRRRQMIESLVVNVSTLPHSQTKNFDIGELILNLPSLSYVELFHEHDLPPYRQLDAKSKKWTYAPELIETLKVAGDSAVNVRLKSWKWSERMMSPGLLADLKTIHGCSTFSRLRKISFVNFQVPSLTMDEKELDKPEVEEEDKNFVRLVGESLEPLLDLKHLVMESSTVVDGQFLSLLPKTIEHLEIVNCWELTAEMLSEYLFTHGRNIRQLTLHHNQSLNLAFLPFLRQCCPDLRVLRMDLLTYNHHEYYKDSDPIYEKLLTVSDIPAWPEAIEVIDLEQLAKWDVDTAEMFFRSLVDQAPNMPKLRHLAIKAMLDVPWRQRSEFRDRWVSKLRRIFLRRAARPRPYHSLIQWPSIAGKEPAEEDNTQPSKAEDDDDEEEEEEIPTRRSTRITTSHAVPPAPSPLVEDSPNVRKRKRTLTSTRNLRKRRRENISYRDPDTDEDLDLDEESDGSEREDTEDLSSLSSPPDTPPGSSSEDDVFIHGLCDIVNIRFDNQKPREFQWGAEDFLDEESNESDDEEWNSAHERDDESDVYAW